MIMNFALKEKQIQVKKSLLKLEGFYIKLHKDDFFK